MKWKQSGPPENARRRWRKPMGRFFIVIIIISIAMVVGMAVLVTHF